MHGGRSFSLSGFGLCKAGRFLHWCFLYDLLHVLGSIDACCFSLFQFGYFEATCCSALGWMSNQLVLLAPESRTRESTAVSLCIFLQGLMWLLD